MKTDIKNNILVIKNETGEEKEYEVIAKVTSEENKKEYVVFTENELDEDDAIITYAYIIDDDKNLIPITDDDEFEFIEKLLANLDNKINE